MLCGPACRYHAILDVTGLRRAVPFTIAHILPWTDIGGVEIATLRIAVAVDQTRFKSIAFCLPDAVALRGRFLDAGCAVATYYAVQPSYLHPSAFLRASLHLAREFRRQHVDLVHCSDLLAAYYAGVAGRIARVPVLCHIRNRFDTISYRERGFLTAVQRFAFVSKDTWQHFGCPVRPASGTVIYDGIDVSPQVSSHNRIRVRQEFNIGDDAPTICMVARVAPQKDYVTLANAAARVLTVEPTARFLIVGNNDGLYRSHYQEVCQVLERCGVAQAFIFTGYREDARRILSGTDIFVLSTHFEGLPLAILEAMAQAKPVLATAVDGIPEVVQDGCTGLLFPHGDSEQLAADILLLLRDRPRATRMGEMGRRLVESRFTKKHFGESMNTLYSKLLDA